MTVLLDVRDLCVGGEREEIVHSVSLELHAGKPLTVLGETGCGKSLLIQAVMGVLPPELKAKGAVRIGGETIDPAEADMRKYWGPVMAILPQEPWLALDPTMRVLPQVREGYTINGNRTDEKTMEKARADLSGLGVDDASRKLPSQLSGGMAQRVAFAAACAGGAQILLADEPTKGLDTDNWKDIVNLLVKKAEEGYGVLTITHDIGVARMIGGDVAVMYEGEFVERGTTQEVLQNPKHDYTRRLLAADPASWDKQAGKASSPEPVIKAESMGMSRGGKHLFDNQDFTISPGEIVGITGPSGCGKSTFGDLLLGLLQPDSGRIWRNDGYPSLRFQKLYQDPPAAFPRHFTIGRTVRDLQNLHDLKRSDVDELMDRLKLPPELLDRLPSQVSGGELQRFSLLRVLLLDPVFLFADEPTSRLDLITQQEIVELLTDLARERNCALLLVSHNERLIENTVQRVHPLVH